MSREVVIRRSTDFYHVHATEYATVIFTIHECLYLLHKNHRQTTQHLENRVFIFYYTK